MLLIENFLASIDWPCSYCDLDLENNYIEDKLAIQLYNRLLGEGNSVFDTYGMWHDINGHQLFNCLLDHFIKKEDYNRCKWLKVRREQYNRLVGYFVRWRREKWERRKK